MAVTNALQEAALQRGLLPIFDDSGVERFVVIVVCEGKSGLWGV